MKHLNETMTTGPAVAGTDSSDPSTPGAKKLFVDLAVRKALEIAQRIVRKRKRHGRKNSKR